MVLPSLFNSDDPSLDISTMPKQYQTMMNQLLRVTKHKLSLPLRNVEMPRYTHTCTMYVFYFRKGIKKNVRDFWLGQDRSSGIAFLAARKQL